MKILAELAAKRDEQIKVGASDGEWRALFDNARHFLRDLPIQHDVTRLLTHVFCIRQHRAANCETIFARVIACAQE